MTNKSNAYHEAGHAVAAHILGRYISKVTIMPDSDCAGRCLFSMNVETPYGLPEWMNQRAYKDLLTICYAGEVSKTLYCQRSNSEYQEGGDKDDLELIDNILYNNGILNTKACESVKEVCHRNAKKIISKYFTAVDRVSKALLVNKTLNGEEAHWLIWQEIEYYDFEWSFEPIYVYEEMFDLKESDEE